MHYKIIQDEQLLREFIEWLPDLQINERFYVALFARKKYCKDVKYIKTDKAQCARVLSKKEDLFKKIQRLEVPLGSYEIKGIEIPQEALALYISMNPRDLFAATRTSLIKFANLLANTYNGYNPHAECMSEIHRNCSRKVWYDFDFDGIEWPEIRDQVLDILPAETLKVMKTRGGFHLLVNLRQIPYESKNSWYQRLSKVPGCDVRGDNLLNVAGCVQSDFIPHFIQI